MPRKKAAQLFWQGYTVAEIQKMLSTDEHQIPVQTIHSWKTRDGWREAPTHARVGSTIDTRMLQLIAKKSKTEGDLREIDVLGKQLERMARVEKFSKGGNEADLNPNVKNRNKKRRRRKHKNYLSEEEITALKKAWDEQLFGYQRTWWDALHHKVRNILKSRQIGATWYFAREAFMNALMTGDNQIFLSASKSQAHVFKSYIVSFVKEVTGVVLSGDPMELENGAELYFLSTNSRTAQSYHGHLYVDEYFWIPNFPELQKVASGMAAHKKWRKTYFSVPSTLGHLAYPFWSGKNFNRGRPKEDHIEIDLSHDALKDGCLCADGQWRQMVTVEDAVAGGCDLFDLEQLRQEYNPVDFSNLFMCIFVDDANSVFSLEQLQRCMVDTWDRWTDFIATRIHPFGKKRVWIGYDPSRSRDDASAIVVAPPNVEGGMFRVLEKLKFTDCDFDTQASAIKALTKKYNVEHIAIDASGMGLGVYELVKQFFPQVVKITYSVEVKTRLVLKALQLVTHGRLQFDASWTDLAHAFLTIHRSSTKSGSKITYQASRTAESGHADMAWALMHALDKEGFGHVETLGGDSAPGRMEMF